MSVKCRHFTSRLSSTRQCDLIVRMMCRRIVNKDGRNVCIPRLLARYHGGSNDTSDSQVDSRDHTKL